MMAPCDSEGAPVHNLSQSYNNITGTCIQFLPHFRGGILEDRFHDARRGTYTVYDAAWAQVQSGDIAAPRDPIPMPSGWAHLMMSSSNYYLRGSRGSVTLLNSVNLANHVPDPPYVTSFAVLGSDLLPVDSVGKTDAATLRFSSRAPTPGALPVVDSIRAFARLHGSSEWVSLPVLITSSSPTGPGVVCTSPLTSWTDQDSTAIDLRIRVVDDQGHASDMIVSPAIAVGAWNGGGETGVYTDVATPLAFALAQNYPNPFNPSTVITYTVGSGGGGRTRSAVLTRLQVFDLLGRHVATLVDDMKAQGEHEVRFDAAGLATGVYLYRLSAGGFVETRKMIVMR